MQANRRVGWLLGSAVVFVVLGLLVAPAGAPTALGVARGPLPSSHVAAFVAAPHPAVPSAALAVPHPALTFPRTVLVETFTGVWCIHCPSESQALYYMDAHSSKSVLTISELHVCAFPPGSGPCLENYVPPDGTSDTRGTFYNVCGFPDVFFDGLHDSCGASNSEAGMLNDYTHKINNASVYPGNVSITDSAVVAGGNVNVQENILSGLSGSYNAITYLMEYIGKRNQSNGYGPHDVGYVVRETLHNHPVGLTPGNVTPLSLTGAINTTWNPQNLSVVSFVQENRTKIIENANFAPVTSEVTTVSSDRSSLNANQNAMISVEVTNSTTLSPLSGASVTLVSDAGGSFSPASGSTDGSGSFTSTFTAPAVTGVTPVTVGAFVNETGYTAGYGATTVTVNPLYPPTVVRAVSIAPGEGNLTINWTAPLSGGTGVTYHLYAAAAKAGPYTQLTATSSTSYRDPGLAAVQTLWFEVSAQGPGGFSVNTTAISATSVSVVPSGLPAGIGWWVSEGSLTFAATTTAALALFFPDGTFSFDYGPDSYAYESTGTPLAALQVSGTPLTLNLTFAPRYAVLQGTVSPAAAHVTLDGVSLTITSGAFSYQAVAGTYWLNASADGYVSNDSMVSLTPGNLTPAAIKLNPVSSPSGAGSGGNPFAGSGVWIVIVAIVVGVGAVAAAVVLIPKKGASGRRAPRTRSPPRPPQDGP